MATAFNRAQIDFTATLTLSEVELRALDALVGYGDDAFIAAFKEKLGHAYIRDHERGLRSAFNAIREQVLPALFEVSQGRRDLGAALRARREALEARAQAGGAEVVQEDPPGEAVRISISRLLKPWTSRAGHRAKL